MKNFIEKIINSIEEQKISFWLWAASFLSLIVTRIMIENWLSDFKNRSGFFIFYEFTHTFLFFIISYILFAILLSYFLKEKIRKISNVLLWGFLIILTPPILDYLISGGKGYWSFYEFDGVSGLFKRFFTFFGDTPEIGITYGVRIEVAMSLLFIFLYSLVKLGKSEYQISKSETISNVQNSKSKTFRIFVIRILNLFRASNFVFKFFKSKSGVIVKSLVITTAAYAIFFILGTFPSYITIINEGFTKGFMNVNGVDVAGMFLSPAKIFSREIPDIVSALNVKMSMIYSIILSVLIPIIFFHRSKEKTLALFKNARYPQLCNHLGLVAAGMALAGFLTETKIEINIFNLISFGLLGDAVCYAWLTSTVINDIYDVHSDEVTSNKKRPLITGVIEKQEFIIIGCILFLASILFSAIVNFKIALLLIAYQAIAWIYSCWPLRLKRFAFISTFLSAIALLLILFSGYILVSPDQNIKSLPFPIIALLVISYTLSLPIKDFKDIEGDKKEGVFTVPVLFGEQWGKLIVAGGIFISFLLSVALLNEFRLFWWAFLAGSISFWIVLSSGNNKKIKYHRLPWWIFGLVFIYGLILVKIVFL